MSNSKKIAATAAVVVGVLVVLKFVKGMNVPVLGPILNQYT